MLTHTYVCKHGAFCGPVNSKSPSSHGYRYRIQIREEKNPMRSPAVILLKPLLRKQELLGQRCLQMSVRKLSGAVKCL